jgi:hypothetical protein
MKKTRYLTLSLIFFCAVISAQKKDSIQTFKVKPSNISSRELDSVGINKLKDSIVVVRRIDSVRIMLDSLIKPFYAIQFDSLAGKRIYKPKFRMVLNFLNEDTTYIPVPKTKAYIKTNFFTSIDTIKILNPIKLTKIDTTKYAKKPNWWKKENILGLDISEAAFSNWNKGGNNSIAGLLKVAFRRSYNNLHLLWNNEIIARYGLNKQQDQGLRKTDDKLVINSTFGYRKDTISHLYYSVKFNFNTQFTNGFNYPDTSNPISRFFAPASLLFGTGIQYELKKYDFSVYLSPITLKSTFVLDDKLSNEGAFGITPGKKSKNESGILLQSQWETEVLQSVTMTNRLSLYSDYIRNFGNVDVDWELNFDLTVNKNIKTNIGAQLIYDDDTKLKEDINGDGNLETLGPRIQLMQLLSIGVTFKF